MPITDETLFSMTISMHFDPYRSIVRLEPKTQNLSINKLMFIALLALTVKETNVHTTKHMNTMKSCTIMSIILLIDVTSIFTSHSYGLLCDMNIFIPIC